MAVSSAGTGRMDGYSRIQKARHACGGAVVVHTTSLTTRWPPGASRGRHASRPASNPMVWIAPSHHTRSKDAGGKFRARMSATRVCSRRVTPSRRARRVNSSRNGGCVSMATTWSGAWVSSVPPAGGRTTARPQATHRQTFETAANPPSTPAATRRRAPASSDVSNVIRISRRATVTPAGSPVSRAALAPDPSPAIFRLSFSPQPSTTSRRRHDRPLHTLAALAMCRPLSPLLTRQPSLSRPCNIPHREDEAAALDARRRSSSGGFGFLTSCEGTQTPPRGGPSWHQKRRSGSPR